MHCDKQLSRGALRTSAESRSPRNEKNQRTSHARDARCLRLDKWLASARYKCLISRSSVRSTLPLFQVPGFPGLHGPAHLASGPHPPPSRRSSLVDMNHRRKRSPSKTQWLALWTIAHRDTRSTRRASIARGWATLAIRQILIFSAHCHTVSIQFRGRRRGRKGNTVGKRSQGIGWTKYS